MTEDEKFIEPMSRQGARAVGSLAGFMFASITVALYLSNNVGLTTEAMEPFLLLFTYGYILIAVGITIILAVAERSNDYHYSFVASLLASELTLIIIICLVYF